MLQQLFVLIMWDNYESFTVLGIYPTLEAAKGQRKGSQWKERRFAPGQWVGDRGNYEIHQTDSYLSESTANI
jgi:hypothetical protein